MNLHIKICGVTDITSAQVAVGAGVEAVGFVFSPSVRKITPSLAALIASELPREVETVAVFRGEPLQDIERVLSEFVADVVQADSSSLVGLESARALPVFRETISDLEAIASDVEGGRFVYEGRYSGVGRAVDWDLAAEISALGQMTLAGGLNPDNVALAIQTAKPFGVDVSSGVESAPGVKDPAKMRAFVQAVRDAEKDLVTR